MFKHMFLVQVGHGKVSGVICDIMLIVKCNILVYKQLNGKHVTHYTYFGHEQ